MDNVLATIDVNPPGGETKGSVIWLHGLGADGQDFVPIVGHFSFMKQAPLRFVFPHAPIRSITVNGGAQMRGWYDIRHSEFSLDEDVDGINRSEEMIQSLIEREHDLGVPFDRILLAGFSQGGAMALYTALRYPKTLAGVVALSTYLPIPSVFQESKLQIHSFPLFMAHGAFDPIIPLMLAQMTHEQLEQLGYRVDWHTYSMGHTVIPEEITAIDQFLSHIYLPT